LSTRAAIFLAICSLRSKHREQGTYRLTFGYFEESLLDFFSKFHEFLLEAVIEQVWSKAIGCIFEPEMNLSA